jgi:hypothetical protein
MSHGFLGFRLGVASAPAACEHSQPAPGGKVACYTSGTIRRREEMESGRDKDEDRAGGMGASGQGTGLVTRVVDTGGKGEGRRSQYME